MYQLIELIGEYVVEYVDVGSFEDLDTPLQYCRNIIKEYYTEERVELSNEKRWLFIHGGDKESAFRSFWIRKI